LGLTIYSASGVVRHMNTLGDFKFPILHTVLLVLYTFYVKAYDVYLMEPDCATK